LFPREAPLGSNARGLRPGGPAPEVGVASPPPTGVRELTQRLSGTAEVLLLWHPDGERVELAVRDLAAGTDFQMDVAPVDALDAFHHPYAYAARRESSYRIVHAGATIDDG
jgi:hypothetical protein